MRRPLALLGLSLALGCSNPPAPTDAAAEAAPVDATAPDAVVSDIALPDVAPTPDALDVSTLDVVAPDAPPDALDAANTELAPPTDASAPTDTLITDALADAPPDGLADAGAPDADPIVWIPVPDAGCNARVRPVAVISSPHVDPDAGPIAYASNPPCSGPHYPEWAHWGTWPVLARGNWVHNLEHGGVVLLNRCLAGDDCAPGLASLSALVPSFSTDPVCVPPPPPDAGPSDAGPPAVRVRVVVTNDALIDTPVAASAWGWLYAADCVDAPSIRWFYETHRGMGTEDFCDDGYVP